eukprot:TRINITY_DN8564_c0_g1_i1.p1 TRINITY_DN8564_c0_g1~~TRINITY_DN8564_c0_g1_i1.p1  ORF type:complete len:331 (-),score=42.83 TRINITY_DN8564_c0_g1_i1:222-1214(-)
MLPLRMYQRTIIWRDSLMILTNCKQAILAQLAQASVVVRLRSARYQIIASAMGCADETPVSRAATSEPVGKPRRTLGILALQGAFEEHETSFKSLPESMMKQIEIVQVRKAEQLDGCDALVIPGGETTTMKIVGNDNSDSFMTTLKAYVHGGRGCDGVRREARPVWGTCAGCILLSDDVVNSMASVASADTPAAKRCKYGEQIGGLPVSTCRNFFGRQAESFEAEAIAAEVEQGSDIGDVDGARAKARRAAFDGYPAVFIRAPSILNVHAGAQVCARVRHPNMEGTEREGVVVAAESQRILVTCFHPELSGDSRIHQYFVEHFVLPGSRA